jgi:hypothetical protein
MLQGKRACLDFYPKSQNSTVGEKVEGLNNAEVSSQSYQAGEITSTILYKDQA